MPEQSKLQALVEEYNCQRRVFEEEVIKDYLYRITLIVCIILYAGCYSYVASPKEVTFTGSGGTELRGSFVLPDGARRPVPAVILLHGAEKATRNFVARMSANIFLERGIAVLLYDKRGAGESGGDFKSTSYTQLIEDAVGAVEFLRKQSEVDPKVIGLIGASQSGWLTPEIADRSGDIAFIINKSGSPLSYQETVAWETFNDLLADNISESSAREQSEMFSRIRKYRVSPTDEERLALEKTLAAWAVRKDSALPDSIRPASEHYLNKVAYDPAPYLERITVPTLYIFGSEDINIPVTASIQRLDELAVVGRPVTYYVFEGKGHELGSVGLYPPGYHFVEGYTELIGDFAAKHAMVP